MTTARSFGNYDLAGALADLVDNSIKAQARNIWIDCEYNESNPIVRITDDGNGMSKEELFNAMRPASTNPNDERAIDDLGRFGWGLKSASFSQCKNLTVISRQGTLGTGANWDLNNIDGWAMGILTEADLERELTRLGDLPSGTEIIWKDCDRLSENGTLNAAEFNTRMRMASDRLSLVFHRFMEIAEQTLRLRIYFNGRLLEPHDPFHRQHNATQQRQLETLWVENSKVEIRPYILPHFSKLKDLEHDRLAGEDGFLRNQGFYVYRNRRLIIHGTWFNLVKFGELSQLVRIAVDIPNSMDDLWKITIDKSDAQLPSALKSRLKQIVDGLRGQATNVFRSKGGNLDRGKVSIWSRSKRNNEVRYSINRDHPYVKSMLERDNSDEIRMLLRLVEQNFPTANFAQDANHPEIPISQTATQRKQLLRTLSITIPNILASEGGNFDKLRVVLKQTEPFSSNWPLVEEYLSENGWK